MPGADSPDATGSLAVDVEQDTIGGEAPAAVAHHGVAKIEMAMGAARLIHGKRDRLSCIGAHTHPSWQERR